MIVYWNTLQCTVPDVFLAVVVGQLDVVKLLYRAYVSVFVASGEYDCASLSPEPTAPADAVEVGFDAGCHLDEYHQPHLLNVNPTREDVSGYEHREPTASKCIHLAVARLCLHLPVK